MTELKEWLNSINFTKEDLSEDMKDYSPYVVNRCLSGNIDCIMQIQVLTINISSWNTHI